MSLPDRTIGFGPDRIPVPAKVIEARVDWITATQSHDVEGTNLHDIGEHILMELHAAGAYLREWHWRGYSGLTAGGSAVGARDDGAIVRLSGDAAALAWRALSVARCHITRLDLAVTIQLKYDLPKILANNYADLRELIDAGLYSRRVSYVSDSDGGDTLYVGRRTGEVFLRLYDKTRESGYAYPPASWRWEVELKRSKAQQAWDDLLRSADQESYVTAAVWDAYKTRGLTPCWDRGTAVVTRSVPAPVYDAERTYAWLMTTVAPAIDRLQEWYDLAQLEAACGFRRLKRAEERKYSTT